MLTRGRLDSETTSVDGRPLHVRVSTTVVPLDAPTFVLVHGLGVSSRYMIPLANQLARSARVFAPDLPGFGKSPGRRRVLNVPELAEALHQRIQTRIHGPLVLVGHSFGCQVVAEYAVHHLDRIEGVVLAGPTVDSRARSLLQQFFRLLVDETREPLSLGVPMLLDYFDAGLPRIIATGHEMIADQLESKLSRISVPALVVRGARDPIVPQRWAEEVTRQLPEGRLAVVPGAPHALNYACPSDLASILIEFASSLRRDSPRPSGRATPPPF